MIDDVLCTCGIYCTSVRPRERDPSSVALPQEFSEAMEEDFQSASKRFWQTKLSSASEGGSSTLPTLFTVHGWGAVDLD
ncbi:hypothetical protein L3Q82_015432 [Scortum barcoo]|uniref:Uncharacterized protein n=1 Tax=Scortum barcoo TaxID=214431 RepID=A0ACB8VTK5_9TELE|nr:hypothetical protein L3Q82_015432 [Scortum barcoo]